MFFSQDKDIYATEALTDCCSRINLNFVRFINLKHCLDKVANIIIIYIMCT